MFAHIKKKIKSTIKTDWLTLENLETIGSLAHIILNRTFLFENFGIYKFNTCR